MLQNNVIVGSVNANRRHFYRGGRGPRGRRPRRGSGRLISRRVPPEDIAEALRRGPDDIKVVVEFGG